MNRIEIHVDGVQQSLDDRALSPTFCVFAGEYHYVFEDLVAKYIAGAKLEAHNETEDDYYLLWGYLRIPSTRIQIQKEDDEHLLMTTIRMDRRGRTRTVYRLTRVDKERTVDWIQRLLKDKELRDQMRQFGGDSEKVLDEWMSK